MGHKFLKSFAVLFDKGQSKPHAFYLALNISINDEIKRGKPVLNVE